MSAISLTPRAGQTMIRPPKRPSPLPICLGDSALCPELVLVARPGIPPLKQKGQRWPLPLLIEQKLATANKPGRESRGT